MLRATCGLFRRSALRVAEDYPELDVEEMLVDACALRPIKDPERFDVIVTTNLFGDILSDEASMLAGGLGLASSANLGAHQALFEPVHGSAPDIAGTHAANPLACILAGAELARHLGEDAVGSAIEGAVLTTLEAGDITPDLGGKLTTEEATDAVIRAVETATSPEARALREPRRSHPQAHGSRAPA